MLFPTYHYIFQIVFIHWSSKHRSKTERKDRQFLVGCSLPSTLRSKTRKCRKLELISTTFCWILADLTSYCPSPHTHNSKIISEVSSGSAKGNRQMRHSPKRKTSVSFGRMTCARHLSPRELGHGNRVCERTDG